MILLSSIHVLKDGIDGCVQETVSADGGIVKHLRRIIECNSRISPVRLPTPTAVMMMVGVVVVAVRCSLLIWIHRRRENTACVRRAAVCVFERLRMRKRIHPCHVQEICRVEKIAIFFSASTSLHEHRHGEHLLVITFMLKAQVSFSCLTSSSSYIAFTSLDLLVHNKCLLLFSIE